MYKKIASAHSLEIERGRYTNVERQSRFCQYCKDVVETESHFLLVCPLYNDIRHEYIDSIIM